MLHVVVIAVSSALAVWVLLSTPCFGWLCFCGFIVEWHGGRTPQLCGAVGDTAVLGQ
jgi:hypothetical protein